MTQQNYRSSADDESNKDRSQTSGERKSGGNAGAGQSGAEDLGSEKKSEDERWGSRKHEGGNQEHEDAGKKDAPGK
jgi:hypothetical protein